MNVMKMASFLHTFYAAALIIYLMIKRIWAIPKSNEFVYKKGNGLHSVEKIPNFKGFLFPKSVTVLWCSMVTN